MIEVKEFMTEAKVWARDHRGYEKWSPGIVTKQTGPVSYQVNVKGQTWNRHAEQLRPAADAPIQQSNEESSELNEYTRPRRNIKEPKRLAYCICKNFRMYKILQIFENKIIKKFCG